MIRINLLGGERQVKKKTFVFDSGRQTMVACILLLALSAGGIGYWFWTLRQASIQVDQDIADATREQARLQSILRDVTAFDQQRDELQQRVVLIEQLRGGQSIPVQLLDEVSKSLPDRLWLSDLTQTGTEFTIGGMTDSLTAVSDFVANLEGTRWFKKPVEILDSQVQTDAKAGDLIKFQIKAQFNDPTAPVAAPAKAGTGRGAAPAK